MEASSEAFPRTSRMPFFGSFAAPLTARGTVSQRFSSFSLPRITQYRVSPCSKAGPLFVTNVMCDASLTSMRPPLVVQFFAIVVFIAHTAGVAAEQERAIVVHQVTVIDGTGSPARPNQTVVISGGRIAALGDSGRVRIPKDARPLSGTGKYLIPGLWDMHVHMRGSRLGNQDSLVHENEALLPVYLANGLTGVREMGGDMVDSVLQWRDEIAKGHRQGPRIVTWGPKLDGPKPTWPGSIPVIQSNKRELLCVGSKIWAPIS